MFLLFQMFASLPKTHAAFLSLTMYSLSQSPYVAAEVAIFNEFDFSTSAIKGHAKLCTQGGQGWQWLYSYFVVASPAVMVTAVVGSRQKTRVAESLPDSRIWLLPVMVPRWSQRLTVRLLNGYRLTGNITGYRFHFQITDYRFTDLPTAARTAWDSGAQCVQAGGVL